MRRAMSKLLWTKRECQDALSVSRSTFDRWRGQDDFPAPAVKAPLRWLVTDIENWLTENDDARP